MKYVLYCIALVATFICMQANGDVLVSNFFDNNSADRGNLYYDARFYEVTCINGHDGDGNPCDSENNMLAMSFTVGGEVDYVFEGAQIELKYTSDFDSVNVYLDKGSSPASEVVGLLTYAGDVTTKAASRRRGTFTADGLLLDRGEQYWIRVERKTTVNGRSRLWFTNSKKQESTDSGWGIASQAQWSNHGDSWDPLGVSNRVMRLSILGARALTADRLTLWYYECPMGPTKYWHWIRFRTSYPIYISNSELKKAFTDVAGGSVDKVKRIRWTHEYINGVKRKVTQEYRLRIIPDATAQEVTIALKESEGCGGSALCAELGLIGDYDLVIPNPNQPPKLSISVNTEHPNYDDLNEGFLEAGDMSFSTLLSGPPISHYRFGVKTVEGKNRGTATACIGSTKACKNKVITVNNEDRPDPDDYYPGSHGQFIIAVKNDDNELVFENPAPTTIYLVSDDVAEDDESVVVKIHNAYTVGDRSKQYCKIDITTSHATGMILDDD